MSDIFGVRTFGVRARGWLRSPLLSCDEHPPHEGALSLLDEAEDGPRASDTECARLGWPDHARQGRAHARGLLTETALVATNCRGRSGALSAWALNRRGPQTAAVATARKLEAVIQHLLVLDEHCAWHFACGDDAVRARGPAPSVR